MNAFPDTLVLKIEEIEQTGDYKGLVDTTLYVLYDDCMGKFIVRGKRRDSSYASIDSCTYSFECEFAHELVDFILFVIDQKNRVSYVLYNYDNLPLTSNEITYEFLARCDTEENNNIAYELAAYDNVKLRSRELVRHLRMLRSVSNRF